MINFRKTIIILSLVTTAFILTAHSVFASDGLSVQFGNPPVPSGAAEFTVSNMMPGDSDEDVIKVKNNNSIAKFITLKSEKTAETKDLSKELLITISEGTNTIYNGGKTLNDFFNDSKNGLNLGSLDAGKEKTYKIKVSLPSSADNQYQNASVKFNLEIGDSVADNLVINEVYYNVDSKKGSDSFEDRSINVQITDNGEGSKNIINLRFGDKCLIVQSNIAAIINNINISSLTGNNKGNGSITSGNSNVSSSISNLLNFNYGSCGELAKGKDDEWVELYNPTQSDISLKNWSLTDDSGNPTKITANKIIKAGGFALISKDASTWNFWKPDKNAVKIELGKEIGNGLGNSGDHLILKDPSGGDIDKVGWGSDTFVWNPAVPNVATGSSIERLSPGFDTDSASDWHSQNPPTPGK